MAGYINSDHFNPIQQWSFHSFEKDALEYIRYVIRHDPTDETIKEIQRDLNVLKNQKGTNAYENIIQKWTLKALAFEIATIEKVLNSSNGK